MEEKMNSGPVKSSRTKLTIVDTDVHHGYREQSDLFPFLSKFNAERFAEWGFGGLSTHLYTSSGGIRGQRADFEAEEAGDGLGTIGGADYCSKHLLDANGIDVAVLTGGIAGAASALPDVDYGSALCRAFNDHSMEHWIAKDPRFRLNLDINSQDPLGAAAEIDRLGSHPAVCGVMFSCGAPKPFGQRFYHPIYEACARHGLAVTMHFGSEGEGVNPPPSAAGFPSYYIESRQLRPPAYAVHLASFIFEGVFEKFPTLKVAMVESGFAWVAPVMWKMDLDWKGLRRHTPWVKRLPSEYLKDHVRFGTQPLDEPVDPEAINHIINWIDGARTLMFASDFPHWDADDPMMTLSDQPEDLRRRIFAENAIETYKLSLPAISKAA
ncbi:amidohydrolase family protein [Mesorhizobium sp. VK4C]|uniref:amidohydrolase family protein n=1 Tax=Mesorhizobium captivum TaxID=3072319 RepID=UPI002A240473|nr:amidohydrolase family protein [Mesorhizobium sp. VK4C]MDX8503114.1 amidohydrolase family protein [Mesorhizobium sp. VK4C]